MHNLSRPGPEEEGVSQLGGGRPRRWKSPGRISFVPYIFTHEREGYAVAPCSAYHSSRKVAATARFISYFAIDTLPLIQGIGFEMRVHFGTIDAWLVKILCVESPFLREKPRSSWHFLLIYPPTTLQDLRLVSLPFYTPETCPRDGNWRCRGGRAIPIHETVLFIHYLSRN